MTDQLWWVVALRDIPPSAAVSIFCLAAIGYLTALSRRQWPRVIGLIALFGSIISMGEVLENRPVSQYGSSSFVLMSIWTLGIAAGVLSLTFINHLRRKARKETPWKPSTRP